MSNMKIFNAGMGMKIHIFFVLLVSIYSCTKETGQSNLRYYEVGFKSNPADWRDSSFIIATADPALISEIETQLSLPVYQRKMVNGQLKSGNGGYNKNAAHKFKWHFKEDSWEFADVSAEIYDGRPYSDVDSDINYWMYTLKRFAPWGSYVKKEISRP